jgi:hypothetical protein
VFGNACNLLADQRLITIVTSDRCDGPTVVRVRSGPDIDLKCRFTAGDVGALAQARLHICGTAVDWHSATVWTPEVFQPPANNRQTAAHVALAESFVSRHRKMYPTVLDTAAVDTVNALEQACTQHNSTLAAPLAQKLVGWGEGLTPAGDDFLVGWLAGLHVLAGHADSRAFFVAVGDAIVRRLHATPLLSAQPLRLAVDGHCNADLHKVRAMLLASASPQGLSQALDRVLHTGATSGAATLAGLLSAIRSWYPPSREASVSCLR